MKRIILFTISIAWPFLASLAQQLPAANILTGKVVAADSQPLPGTGLTLKISGDGTITDNRGNFTLKLSVAADTLEISHIGYQTKLIAVTNKTISLTIQLQKAVASLQEVVVNTGYQTIPRERATGSFDFIDNKTLNEQVGTNILQRLNGVASGVLFRVNKNDGSNTHIAIRGLSTINGPLDPLIVLDGFIYEGDINNINPNDVESISILKDAAATSIWGARAGNGVLVITTKKGHFNQKLQVSFNSDVIFHQKPDLFSLPQMSSSDYINVEQFLFNQGYFSRAIGLQYGALTPAVEIFQQRSNGIISSADSASEINTLKSIDSRNQYLKYFYTNAITRQYSLNIRGGNNNNAYTFSLDYDKALDELSGKSSKLNIGFENIFRPAKNLTIDLHVYYTNSVEKSGKPNPSQITIDGRHVPYLQFMSDSGKALPVDINYNSAYTDTLGGGQLLNWNYYPLDDWKHNTTSTNLQEIFANTSLKYKIASFLGIDLQYQYQKQQQQIEQLSDVQSYYGRNLINLFSQVDPSAGVTYIVPVGGIQNLSNSWVESNTLRGQLNFNYSWKNSAVYAIAGSEIRQTKNYGDNSTVYGYSADPLYVSNVDFVNYYPTIINGNYQSIPGNFSPYNTIYRYASFYGNASFTFKNRYILSASARKDGANIFGLNANDKWKPLWSTGLGWNISNELFYKWAFIPTLKLRATYGLSGNIDPSKTALATARYGSGAPYTGYPYVRIQTINNPDLNWEKSRMINIGMDFIIKNDILSGSIEYYLKKGSNLYGPVPMDYTTGGWSQIVKNVADMKGKGADITLNSRNIDREFKWGTTLLLNYNMDKTTKYYSTAATQVGSKLGGGTYIVPVIGEPLFAIAAYKWEGLDSAGNPQGYIKGQKSTDYLNMYQDGDIVYIGPSSPTVFGSLINTFSWKGIALSANIAYRLGYYFQKPSISYSSLVMYGVGNGDYDKRWQKPGDEAKTNVPSFIYPVNENRDAFYNQSAINVLKADNVRLQYVNLSYSITRIKGKELPFSGIQIYMNIANVGILWRANKQGIDPDYPSTVPPERTYAFGIRADF